MNKKKLVVCSLLILLVFYAILLSIICFNPKAKETQYQSGLSWLESYIISTLDDEFKKTGRYPNNLDELRIPFPGDNASPEMLRHFKYESSGSSYELTMNYDLYGHKFKHKWKGVDGNSIFVDE
jgi:hypothetical protein